MSGYYYRYSRVTYILDVPKTFNLPPPTNQLPRFSDFTPPFEPELSDIEEVELT